MVYLVLSCVLGMIFVSSDFQFVLISVLNWPYLILFIIISHEVLKYFSALMPACVLFKSQYCAYYAV